MSGVSVRVDIGSRTTKLKFNDPSDALDYLISMGVSKSVAIKREPDIGWSWDDLPLTIPWKGTMYTVKNVKTELNCPEMVVRTRFNHVIASLDEKHGTGYGSKNPNLVMHMMDQISNERQIQSEF